MNEPLRPDYQNRVIQEKAELDERLNKLGVFIKTNMFMTLNKEEQGRLSRQFDLMSELSEVLAERIAAFDA